MCPGRPPGACHPRLPLRLIIADNARLQQPLVRKPTRFHDRLHALLTEAGFDRHVEEICLPHSADEVGRLLEESDSLRELSMSQAHSPNAVLSTERLLAASPRSVFAAFEQPDQLARWWGGP